MRLMSTLLALSMVCTPSVYAQTASSADSAAIMGALQNWERAWEVLDPELAARDYSDDADWTNAFGMRRTGRVEIQALLTEVFALPFVTAGSTTYQYHDLTFAAHDIALLRSLALREGQQLPDGTVEETRRTNHLRVFARRNGNWLIISHLIGDERTPGQPR